MSFLGQFTERSFDFSGGAGLRHPKDIVRVHPVEIRRRRPLGVGAHPPFTGETRVQEEKRFGIRSDAACIKTGLKLSGN